MSVTEFDRIQLKDGRVGTVVDVLEPGAAYIVDIDIVGPDWETIEIRQEDIFQKIS